MNEMKERTFGDKVKERISPTVTIPISFPKNVYARLKSFARDEACNTYWNAIEKLLSYYDENEGRSILSILMLDRIGALELRMDSYEEEPEKKELSREERLRPKIGQKKGE